MKNKRVVVIGLVMIMLFSGSDISYAAKNDQKGIGNFLANNQSLQKLMDQLPADQRRLLEQVIDNIRSYFEELDKAKANLAQIQGETTKKKKKSIFSRN